MRVSVIVPTYDPGPYIERCFESLVAQTLPATEFEVLFVDDGSTDGTPDRLEAWASEHDNVRDIRSQHSGWAGRPRNIGIDHATGTYVQFVDQDDRLAPDALRRLVDVADRNHADIVLGKVVSDFRAISDAVFRANVDRCSIHDSSIVESLTPHKLFRRSFLDDHAIRFPEGRRRLEDQSFVIRAYLTTDRVSILADYPCYFYLGRDDKGNAGRTPIDPDAYFANVREIIGFVVDAVPPGPRRTRLLLRFVRTEMLKRLSEPWFLRRTDAERVALLRAIRPLLRDVVDADVAAGLGAIQRSRVELVRQDRLPALVAFAQRAARIEVMTTATTIRWQHDRWEATLESRFTRDGRPIPCVRRGGTVIFDPDLTQGITDPIDIGRIMEKARLQVSVRADASAVEWLLPVTSVLVEIPIDLPGSPEGAFSPTLIATVPIDPRTMAQGAPIEPGEWALRARLSGAGLARTAPVRSAMETVVDPVAGPRNVFFDDVGRRAAITWSTNGLALLVVRGASATDDALVVHGRGGTSHLGRTSHAARATAKRLARHLPYPVRQQLRRLVGDGLRRTSTAAPARPDAAAPQQGFGGSGRPD